LNWTTKFIARCLDGLPKDNYRARATAELTDHLLELAEELEAGGYSPEEAQARTLELMGDPEQLNPSFRAEWVQRASRLGYCVGRVFRSAFYGILCNTLIRGMLFLPIMLLTGKLYSPYSPTVLLIRVVCFLPGLWLAVYNVRKDFSLFPPLRQTSLCYIASLFVWLLDLSSLILGTVNLSFFFTFFSCIPLIALDKPFILSYLLTQGCLCVVLPLFYRTRPISGGEPHQLDN